MRETFTSLLQTAKNYVVDDNISSSNGLSDTDTFLRKEINNAVRHTFSIMKEYSLEPLPKTASTVASQIYYHYPPGMSKIETIKVTVGTISPPLKLISTQEEWDYLQQFPNIVSAYPQAFFPRRDDFGLYPTPQAVYTITLVGNYQPINMTNNDYTQGTIAVTNNNQTITGSGSTFTAAMVGRWFSLTSALNGPSNGSFYRLTSYASATSMNLETYFQEATGSGLTYLVGESPEIPSELHEFIPYRVAAIYYGTRRREADQAKALMNFYYTGDFDNENRKGTIKGGILGAISELKERGRDNSQIVDTGFYRRNDIVRDNTWGVTITVPAG